MIIKDKKEVIHHLLNKKIVAIFQGESEWGPRALGNRSILFDPRVPNAKEIINTVKKREWYRPFAGSILLEHAKDYFEMATIKESPYMSFAMPAKPKAKKEVPGIIHVDGTCRVQTVTEEQNKVFYNLIKLFYEKTGVPILFNTSFNLAGESLVQTIEDAKRTVNKSGIDYLYIPSQ
jgi:carbamoyltransferase